MTRIPYDGSVAAEFLAPSIDDVPSCGQENDYRRAQSSAGSASAPRLYIINQHIGWLKQYVIGMGEDNWKDIRDLAERQLEALSEEIDKEAAALAGATQPTWQPIETAPKDGTAVMLGFWYQGRFAQYQAFYGEHGWMENSRSYHSKQFQKWFELWQPLPASPSLPSTHGEGGK